MTWNATGGDIGHDGVFAAGEDEGNFLVTAEADGKVGTTGVSITKKDPPKIPEPKKLKKLTWKGVVAPQKWTNFYMKVLTKLVSVGELRLDVSVEATPKDGVTDQQIEETKAALRGLGLDDNVFKE